MYLLISYSCLTMIRAALKLYFGIKCKVEDYVGEKINITSFLFRLLL